LRPYSKSCSFVTLQSPLYSSLSTSKLTASGRIASGGVLVLEGDVVVIEAGVAGWGEVGAVARGCFVGVSSSVPPSFDFSGLFLLFILAAILEGSASSSLGRTYSTKVWVGSIWCLLFDQS
jgi:hypothetical protein